MLSGGRDVDDNIIESIDRYNVLTDVWDVPYNWTNATSDGVAFSTGTNYYIAGGYDKSYLLLSNNLTMIDTTKTGDSAFFHKEPMRLEYILP
jgi:hypothetical protein